VGSSWQVHLCSSLSSTTAPGPARVAPTSGALELTVVNTSSSLVLGPQQCRPIRSIQAFTPNADTSSLPSPFMLPETGQSAWDACHVGKSCISRELPRAHAVSTGFRYISIGLQQALRNVFSGSFDSSLHVASHQPMTHHSKRRRLMTI